MNLHEKILAVMNDVESLSKDGGVSYKSTNYKYLSAEKTIKVMRDELAKYKLVVYPVRQESQRIGDITHLDITYRIVDTENPDDYIEVVSCGDGMDAADKASGKAMTYAYKYMFWRTFCIPVGDDPDKIASEQLVDEQNASNAQGELITELQGKTLQGVLKSNNCDVKKFFADYGITKLSQLTKAQYAKAAKELEAGAYAQTN